MRKAEPTGVVECDPSELGWRRDIVGQTGEPTGRTWIKPDGTFYTFPPGARMVLFVLPPELRLGMKQP